MLPTNRPRSAHPPIISIRRWRWILRKRRIRRTLHTLLNHLSIPLHNQWRTNRSKTALRRYPPKRTPRKPLLANIRRRRSRIRLRRLITLSPTTTTARSRRRSRWTSLMHG
ncbi:hypothetical protein ABW19_dt0205843 [Dactylella cylindrospora]|nr:hypothetical protein ABW19_dt0205843 [Dactylella cylindrospora]